MVRSPNGQLVPGDESNLLTAVPRLAQIAQITHVPLWQDDSANLKPLDWARLARAVASRYDDFDGFVIAHGTDTLAYTAAALSFFLQGLGKPVVLTGAQIPISEIGSDGPSNLVNSFRVATADLAEVVVVFGSTVIRGTRARKTSAFHLEAFQSINQPVLGRIGLWPELGTARVRRSERRPQLHAELEPRVALLMAYPGMGPDMLAQVGSAHRGLVLLGYGVGTLPSGEHSLVSVVQDICQSGTAVVIGTQCTVGRTALGLYGSDHTDLDATGAIPAGDMTPEAALVKLMWVLGQCDDLSTTKDMMLRDYVGELGVSS